MIKNAPFYVSNHALRKDLKINTIEETDKILSKRFSSQLTNHSNPLISVLGPDTISGNPPRRREDGVET
jgi:hypothetical protein